MMQTKEKYYIIHKNKPFQGSVVNAVYRVEGKAVIPYQKLSFRDYMTINADKYELVNGAKMDLILDAYYESRRTPAREIEESEYTWLLECLPPCKWAQDAAFSSFHMSERICGNIVTWCGTYHDKYWRLDDHATATKGELLEKVKFLFDNVGLTTAQLRNAAHDAEKALQWVTAGKLYRLAIERYPSKNPANQLAQADIKLLTARAEQCERFIKTGV